MVYVLRHATPAIVAMTIGRVLRTRKNTMSREPDRHDILKLIVAVLLGLMLAYLASRIGKT